MERDIESEQWEAASRSASASGYPSTLPSLLCDYPVTPTTRCVLAVGHEEPQYPLHFDSTGRASRRRPGAHSRADRLMREVAYPSLWPFQVAQINYVAVTAEGQNCPSHRHSEVVEVFVCLEGRLVMEVGRLEYSMVELNPGDELIVEPGVWHDLRADPNSRYLELRSTLYDPARPDKEFMSAIAAAQIERLNRQANFGAMEDGLTPITRPL